MKTTIKIATNEDIGILNRLNIEVQNFHNKIFPNRFKPHSISNMNDIFEKFIKDKKSTIIIIYNNITIPIGYIIYENKEYKETGFTFGFKLLYIHHISVNKEYQGNGIGKKLIQIVIDKAKELYITNIELDARSKNCNAKDFFNNMGFEIYNEKMYLNI